ncbi:MAG: hypothetical protein Ta2D_06490 [Rickettsiales bacterium]|nr:MAG: hypothetical protein Ta2D_06490 [Rickettsiales bacterium]
MPIKTITFGCRLNSYESEVIKTILKEKIEDKEIIIFNSCTVTNEAERQLQQSIRKHKRENPDSVIAVVGCAVETNRDFYEKMPEVDFVLGNKEKFELAKYLNKKDLEKNSGRIKPSQTECLKGLHQQSFLSDNSIIKQSVANVNYNEIVLLQNQKHIGNSKKEWEKIEKKYVDGLDENLDKLLQIPPIKEIENCLVSKDEKQNIKNIGDYYKSIGGSVERDDIGIAILSNNGIRQSFNEKGSFKSIYIDFVKALYLVPDVIKNGIIIQKEIEHNKKNENSYLIALPAIINNKNMILSVVIREKFVNKKQILNFYLHQITLKSEIIKIRRNQGRGKPSHTECLIGLHQQDSHSRNSILKQFIINVNTYKEKLNEVERNQGRGKPSHTECLIGLHPQDSFSYNPIIQQSTANVKPLITGFENKTRAFIQIQDGCDNFCTFCATRLARGHSISIEPSHIIKQINMLKNYKEIVLTGIDITDYGKGISENMNLGQLIKRILQETDLPRLRLSSIDIHDINDNLKDVLYNESRLMPHIHLSLQSGDDTILKAMNRRHNRQDIIDFCKEYRQARPNAGIGADFIAGFPTETDAMHQNTCNLIKEVNIVFGHIFPYSVRANTPAATMPQIDISIRKQRAKELREICEQQLKIFTEQELKKEQKILVENETTGRTENYIIIPLKNEKRIGDIINYLNFI